VSRYTSVKNKLKEHKALLLEKFGIQRIGIFGSVAIQKDSETSDIDLLYTLTENKKIGFIELDELENFICTLLNYQKVDLVNEARLNPLFKKEVLENTEYV
jgi:hypothetical protein|tara:strand:+ start:73 stop:375 length:303 start_codon:yes stop_codon:yes gene_type:complete